MVCPSRGPVLSSEDHGRTHKIYPFGSVLDKGVRNGSASLTFVPTSHPSIHPFEGHAHPPYVRLGLVQAATVSFRSSAELGDRKPSQLLRDMERLVGGRTIDPGMFRQLFLQRLPRNVVWVLKATRASVDLATQAEIADKLMELNAHPFGRTVSGVQTPPVSPVPLMLPPFVRRWLHRRKQLHTGNFLVVDRGPVIPVRTSHAAGAPRATVGSRQVAMMVCVITTDALEMQHGSALHLVRTHPPPHQPPNLWETPRQGTNGDPPSWLSPSSGRRLFVTDRRTGVRFLVDTGTEVSVLPTSHQDRTRHHSPSSPPLTAVNGSSIKTFGQRCMNIDLGLRRSFHGFSLLLMSLTQSWVLTF